MKTIRASEIGAYLFCGRAWWYQSQGAPSQNQTELAGGTAFHHQHGQQVVRSGLLYAAGWALLLMAIVILAVGLTLYFLG